MELSTKLDGAAVDRDYKTPLHKLARRWKGSAQLWKDKYFKVKAAIKAFKNAAADARRSRDRWRLKAEHWQATAQQLQRELDSQRSVTAAASDTAVQKKHPSKRRLPRFNSLRTSFR